MSHHNFASIAPINSLGRLHLSASKSTSGGRQYVAVHACIDTLPRTYTFIYYISKKRPMGDVKDDSAYIGIELSEHLCFKFDSLFHGAKTIPIIYPPATCAIGSTGVSELQQLANFRNNSAGNLPLRRPMQAA